METIQLIVFIALGAILVEAVVNALEVFKGFSPTKKWLGDNWQYLIALVVSILAAITYNLDFFDALGFDARIPYVGVVFTGIIISRGSNYANDIISRVRAISQSKSSATIAAAVTTPPAELGIVVYDRLNNPIGVVDHNGYLVIGGVGTMEVTQ